MLLPPVGLIADASRCKSGPLPGAAVCRIISNERSAGSSIDRIEIVNSAPFPLVADPLTAGRRKVIE